MKRQRGHMSTTTRSYPVYIDDVREDVSFDVGATIRDLGRFLSGRQNAPVPLKATITTYTPCTSASMEWKDVHGEHVAVLMRHNGRLVCKGSVVILTDSPMPETLLSHIARPTDGALLVQTHIHPHQLDRGECDIFVKTLTGETIKVATNYGESVALFKERIAAKTGVDPDDQRLIQSGRQLDDRYHLVGFDLKRESTVSLVLRLRGGMMHVSSGRMDYCSTCPPPAVAAAADPAIPAARICIENGPTFYCHPDVPLEMVERTVAMEMDPDFFNGKTRQELESYATVCRQLSHEALQRLAGAMFSCNDDDE